MLTVGSCFLLALRERFIYLTLWQEHLLKRVQQGLIQHPVYNGIPARGSECMSMEGHETDVTSLEN